MADGSVKIDVTVDDNNAEEALKGVGDAAKEAADSIDELGKNVDDTKNKTDETKSKFQELTETISSQKTELSGLRDEYTQAVINFGKDSAEAKELQLKMQALNSELGENRRTLNDAESAAKEFSSALDGVAKEAADSIDELGKNVDELEDSVDELVDSSDSTSDGFNLLDMTAANLAANGLSTLIGKLGEGVSALFDLAESTREYREDMAKLDAAFTTTGHTSETARAAYRDFYAILGESDRSVEAVNHLAELTQNEKEVAQWSTIAAGVTAKFGDSLPIEGLTEAANETAKVGQVTGPLADALNWAGISEDDFNDKLKTCANEQERASLITSTLNDKYSEAADEYNDLTKNTQDARLATADMEQAQADLGEAVEPLTTAWTNLKTKGLQAIKPVIETVANKFTEFMGWLQEHPAVLSAITGALIGLAGALGILTAAVVVQTAAQWLQNAAWLANPITWIILAIVVAIGAIVGAFVYLWNNCDAFREFWVNLWENIKNIASTVWEAIKGFFTAAWEGIKSAWSKCGEFFSGLWEDIKNVFSDIGSWFSDKFTTAWEGIKSAWSAVVGFFQGVWNGIKNVFSAVGSWFSNIFTAAKNGVTNAFNSIVSFFTGIWNSIKQVFSDAKSKFLEIGRNIVAGIKQGISNAWNNMVSWFKGLFGDLIGIAKKILGIHSPSTEFEYIGDMLMEGLSKGIDNNRNKAISNLQELGKDMIKVMTQNAELEIEQLEDTIEQLQEKKDKGNKEAIEAEIKTLKKELELKKERSSALSKWTSTFEKQLDEMSKIEEDYAKNSAKINEDLLNDIAKTQEEYDKSYESRVKSLVDGMGLFDIYEKGDKSSASELTKNLESQVRGLKDYNKALDDLSAKNVNPEFIDYLKDMGMDALPNLEVINKMTDKELDKYVSLWEEKNELARQAATDELATMRQETADEIEALKMKAEADQTELRQSYRDSIIELAGEMANGMAEAGDAGIDALASKFDEYYNCGVAMMQGVEDGIESKADSIVALLVNNVEAAIRAAKEAADIHSPSKRMRDEVGKPMGDGLIIGFRAKMSAIRKAMASDVQSMTATARATVSAETAKYGRVPGVADSGMSDLTRAVGIQTAGINSLAGEFSRGTNNVRPVIIELNGRELGRAVLDVGNAENIRVGAKLSTGGVY